jgi:hypothetical protein
MRKIELKKDIVEEIGEQLKWYSHVMQLQDDKSIKQIMKWNPTETRKCGRSNITWNGGVIIIMEKTKINNKESLDQDMWKRKVLSLYADEICIYTEIFL